MNLKRFIGVAALVVLSACSSLGIPTPQNFQERVIGTQIANTAAVELIGVMSNQGILAKRDAQNLLRQTDVMQEGIDIVKAISVTDLQSAETRLAAIVETLQRVQSYLALQQATKRPDSQSTNTLQRIGTLK